MSAKPVNTSKKLLFSKYVKWFLIVFVIILLEIGTIFCAVKISESKNIKQEKLLNSVSEQVSSQEVRLKSLESIPSILANNIHQLNAFVASLNIVNDDLNKLKEDVNAEKIQKIESNIEQLSVRTEAVEETKNIDALILGIALMIKENALYSRSFAREIEILKELASSQSSITNDIETIDSLKGQLIDNDDVLIKQYQTMAKDFIFKEDIKKENESLEDSSTISRSIKLIKDTVSEISFDKVVILNKDTKTSEQKLMLLTLEDFINKHNFVEAINFISSNPEFNKIESTDFVLWQERVKKKIAFDNAISNIIASELNAIRFTLIKQ